MANERVRCESADQCFVPGCAHKDEHERLYLSTWPRNTSPCSTPWCWRTGLPARCVVEQSTSARIPFGAVHPMMAKPIEYHSLPIG